ncbi:alpha/beta hydrolase [Allorhizobium sp. BGMRC 0089]|uniref:alpha/beta hydrolase n=1 Tax=Allorhizobium sonneratiae TaxID=2934936 RepID=UPI00203481B0|nr:alpha/beta hydrolase [Allorhizobium sonneratiae]MCM2292217.1 alpha/beta hydrolase [Allorhizobium sonneratiae]
MKMSTVHFSLRGVLTAFSLFAWPVSAANLLPFKDALFSSQTVLESHDGGDFQIIDYSIKRDLKQRDLVPELRVRKEYTDLDVRRYQKDEVLDLNGTPLAVTRTGPADGAAFTVIFIHGRGGDRHLGSSDIRFGGNFNRLKNLILRNGGVYYTPTVQSFDQKGADVIAALIHQSSLRSKGRPVVIACASMGSTICWGIARNKAAVHALSGMAILGGSTDPGYAKSAAYKSKLRLWFTHGSQDQVYRDSNQIRFYEHLHKSGYPARFTLFLTGSHGTPVRMSDWKAMLNWLLPT